MVVSCCICPNKYVPRGGISFHRLPAIVTHIDEQALAYSKERRETWLRLMRMQDMGEKEMSHLRVCSAHFDEGR